MSRAPALLPEPRLLHVSLANNLFFGHINLKRIAQQTPLLNNHTKILTPFATRLVLYFVEAGAHHLERRVGQGPG